ncbi:MAG: RNA methyltransferase [Spirochaetaceae bacterium]|nr:RNA methyltransferase [Spirochaetaceae bacterium]
MRLEDVIFVLARPSEPGNTGAVCRAVKNMCLRRLRIAASELPTTPADTEKLLSRAVHAAEIWEGAEHFDSLQAALADCAVSVGTSRRRGRRRKSSTLTPRELAAFLKDKNGKAAIVFGNERTGLNGEELELCNMASHIPVNPEFPSINLSHAVQIYAYELYQTLEQPCRAVPGQWVPMAAGEIDTLVKNTTRSLASIGFYKHPGREEQERFLRDLMARAGLSLSEGRYLSNIIAKAGRLGI